MKYNISLFILICYLLVLWSCQAIVPFKTNLKEGYRHEYTKLDFKKIANPQDTSWHNEVKPLADLIYSHPNWNIEISTALADSSTQEFDNRLDVVVCRNISKYIIERGIQPGRLISRAYHHALEYKGKRDKKNLLAWSIRGFN